MIEDLTGNIKRVIDGLAHEIALRVGCDRWPGCGCGTQSGPHTCEGRVHVESHARQVLLDWFLGEFIPTEKR